jgi:TonB family protein
MNPPNLLAYAAQVTIIVLACAGLPRLLGLRSPGVQYAFWRTLLVLCILLPIVQPWQPGEMAFVPAAGPAPAGVSGGPAALAPATVVPPPASFDWMAAARIVGMIGIAARLAWIGLGMVRLRRMRRRAVETATGFESLQGAIGAAAPILWSPDARHPVTFGVLRPVVLLPAGLKTADPAAQRAVVAHELHHVKRRDWAWVVAEELVRSVFWFHPAMWWLVSRVQLARETVVDELSILATNARRTYLDTLMAFADDTGLVSPPAFSARRHLFHRIMLLSKEGEMSSIRVAFGSCVLVLALGGGAWSAVTAFPLYGEPPQQAPPRDPQSAAAYHRTAVESFERVRKDTTLTADQKREMIVKAVAAEDRALALRPDWLDALVYKNVLLRMQAVLTNDPQEMNDLMKEADALRDRALTLQAAQVSSQLREMPPPPPPAPSSRRSLPPRPPPPPVLSAEWTAFQALLDQYKPLRVGGEIKAPNKIRDVRPFYPPIAQASRVQGVVIIEGILDADGTVVGARVLRSIPLLDQAALDAVRQWQFEPPLVDGTPRAVLMTVTVNFNLQ